VFYPSVVTVLEEVWLLLYLIYSRRADTHACGLARWADVRFLFVCSLLGALSEVIQVNFNKSLVHSHFKSANSWSEKGCQSDTETHSPTKLISNLISKIFYSVTGSSTYLTSSGVETETSVFTRNGFQGTRISYYRGATHPGGETTQEGPSLQEEPEFLWYKGVSFQYLPPGS
jgi:hypothetical protein